MTTPAPPALTRAERRRRLPRGLRFTREGRVFVLMTIGIGGAAVNTGNNLMYLVLGLMLSLIVLSGVLSDLVLWWVRVRRVLPERAFAGTPSVTELVVTNEKRWLPTFSLEIADEVDDAPAGTAAEPPREGRAYILKIAPASEAIVAYRRTPARRGLLRLARLRLTTRYPFGLFEKWRLIEQPEELVVYPALAPVVVPDPPRGLALDPHLARIGPPGADVAGLRDHRDGDEARAVHARRSAALGRLVVREREREAGAQLSILLDDRRPEGAPPGWDASFERAISEAASIADGALRRGAAVELVTSSGRVPFVAPGRPADPIWRHLAELSPAPSGAPAGSPGARGAVLRVGPGAVPHEAAP